MERTLRNKVSLLVDVAVRLPSAYPWAIVHKPGDVTTLVLIGARRSVEVVAEVGGYDVWIDGAPEFNVSAERAIDALALGAP